MSRVVRVVIHGRVQGVGYRMWCAGQASALGLGGWVRNLGDNAVEAVLAGEPASIDLMIENCRGGPPMADVTAIDRTEATEDLLTARAGQSGFVVLANG